MNVQSENSQFKSKEDVFKEAFLCVRPVCVSLTKEATSTNAKELLHILEHQDSCTLQHLQQYILFPLRVILYNARNKSEDLVEATLECLLEIFKKTRFSNWQCFSDYFQLLSMLLSPDPQINSASFAEEIQFVTIKCLHQLIKSADDTIISSLYSYEYLNSLGHAVSVLVNAAEHQKLHTLRVRALSCLASLCQDSGDVEVELLNQIGNLFASFLPGASSSLVKIIINEPKFAKQALHAWGCMLVRVLDDSGVNQASKTPYSSSDTSTHKFIIVRNEAWLKNTKPKLHVLLTKASVAAKYDNWNVRLEVIDFVKKLLISCKRSLNESTPILIEMLVGLTTDQYPEVAGASKTTLLSIQKAFHENECRDITEILEDNLYSLTTSLPRTIMAADDTEKLAKVNLLQSYIELLGCKISSVLCSSSHLKRLSHCLMTALEFDTEDIKITQEKNLYHDTPVNFTAQDFTHWNPERCFKRFNDNKIEEVLRNICRKLGSYGDLDVLVEHFVDIFLESSIYKKQAVWVLNELIAGCRYPNPNSQTCIIRLINEYLSSSSWTTENQQGSNEIISTPSSINAKNSIVLLNCLLLEGFAVAAKVMKNEFEHFLINTLYPVMIKVSNTNLLISQTAQKTTQEFANACSYSSIEELVFRNVDYLLDCLSVELRHVSFNTNALLVLQAMLQYGGENLLPLIQQSINQVLNLIGENQEDDSRHLLLVCKALVKAIRKWHVNVKDTVSIKETSESVCEFIVKHHRLQQENICNSNLEETADNEVKPEEKRADLEEDESIEPGSMEEGPKETKLMHVTVVVQVLENCVHLLGFDSSRQQTLILDIVMEGIMCISPYQDKLLPLAHQLWPTIVQRLSNTNYNVRIKAVECITTLSNCCLDFLKKRVLKDVLPKLTEYLKQHQHYSFKKEALYHHKLEYKLLVAILNNVGQICVKVGVDGLDVLRLAVTCLPYIDDNQPATLKASSQELMEQLKSVEYDAIDLMLKDYDTVKSLSETT